MFNIVSKTKSVKLSKNKGFSLYDILISLVIFVLISVFLTNIFVKNIEVNNTNKVLDACTFEAIETFEQIRSLNKGQGYKENEYLSKFTREQKAEEVVYKRNFMIGVDEYLEAVHVAKTEGYESEKIKTATVSDNLQNSKITYDNSATSLYKISIKIYDKNNNEVYNIETNFTEDHKVLK